jgi:hypothetical protein
VAKDRVQLLRDLEQRVTAGAGVLDRSVRQAAAGGQAVAGAMGALVDKVRRHAYRVTDDDVAALLVAGTTQDEVFEVAVATALGEGARRYRIVEQLLATEEGDGRAP